MTMIIINQNFQDNKKGNKYMKYRILYDRYFNNHNKKLIYKNKIVAGLSFYVRICILDKNNNELFLKNDNTKDYSDITSDFFRSIQFSIDNHNKLISISIYRDIAKYLSENHNIRFINVSCTDFSIDLYIDDSCLVCEPHIVNEKEFINFLIDNHINFEISDNINAQNCAYCYEEVKSEG